MYNPFSLGGKTILITGASSGIGRATAIECSRMGARLVLTARNEQRLQETLSQLESNEHSYICADLTSENEIKSLVEQLPALDGLVLNAGIGGLYPIKAITQEKLAQIQNINLNAPIILTKLLAKKRKLNKGSSIVFTASVAGVYRATIGNAIYATTKCGIDAFMRTAALEFAPMNIRCNSVNPAIIETELTDNILTTEIREQQLQEYPLGRYGKPQDVAYAIIYLLSDASAWMTGSALKLDGGLTIR